MGYELKIKVNNELVINENIEFKEIVIYNIMKEVLKIDPDLKKFEVLIIH